jgi:glycine/D-amino acid oxidase-like deaminating enzyme
MPTAIDYHGEKPFYALPRIEVAGVKVGWHHAGLPLSGPDEATDLDRGNLAAVREFVARRFPRLVPQPIAVAHCLYTSTPDHHFILDRHPGDPRIAIGAGFSGHGFKFAPVVGEILAALALDEEPPVPIGMFSLGRFQES